jgi:arsenite-transporting ATPase
VVTGKGGVGKTTVAGATAVRCAQLGHRTALLSTDPAHSLADVLDVPLGDQLREVLPNLHVRQMDARARMEAHWSEIRDYLVAVLDWAGVDDVAAEELTVLPGLDELFALGDVVDLDASGEFDVLVVDCAPTAETIRLLSLPDVASWYMERLFPMSRRLTRTIGPVVSRLAGGVPIADDRVFDAAERLHDRLARVRLLLADPDRCSIRLVVNPERMVIAEARRTHTYLSLFGFRTDAVVVNRILPDAVADEWFSEWRAQQAEHLDTITSSFSPVPILRVPLRQQEVIGPDRLAEVAAAAFGETDPSLPLSTGPTMCWGQDGDERILALAVPGLEPGAIDLARVGGHLVLTVGPQRRLVELPDSLRNRPVGGAAIEDGWLRVRFGPPVAAGPEAGDDRA